jgi:hypothetical protein
VKLESGLRAVVRDGTERLEQAIDVVQSSALMKPRCLFHTLRNVSDKCLGLAREDTQQILDQARTISQAQNAQETQEQRATQSQAVATFEHAARADYPLLCVERKRTRSGADDLAVGTDEPRVAAQVSASGLFEQPQGN